MGTFHIAEYHQAYLDAERHMLRTQLPCLGKVFDGKVEIFAVETNHDKAKGSALVAKLDGRIVGRMFVANAADAMHLTFLSTYNASKLKEFGIDEVELQSKMLREFLESRNPEEVAKRQIRTSCIADYKYTLIEMGKRTESLSSNPMFEFLPRDDDDLEDGAHIGNSDAANVRMQISVKDLANLVGVDFNRKKSAENPTTAPSSASAVIGGRFNPLSGDVPCP